MYRLHYSYKQTKNSVGGVASYLYDTFNEAVEAGRRVRKGRGNSIVDQISIVDVDPEDGFTVISDDDWRICKCGGLYRFWRVKKALSRKMCDRCWIEYCDENY